MTIVSNLATIPNSRGETRRFARVNRRRSLFLSLLVAVLVLGLLPFWRGVVSGGGDISEIVKPFIWQPRGECMGNFVSEVVPWATEEVYAVVREAIIDKRRATYEHYLENHADTPFVRVLIFLTLHLSVRGALSKSSVTLQLAPGITARVEYFQQVEPFINKVPPERYVPGTLNQKGATVSEWQLCVSLTPSSSSTKDFYNHVMNISMHSPPAMLQLDLPLTRYDNESIPFRPTVALACATGWFHPAAFPLSHIDEPLSPRVPCVTGNASGAVVFSGSALYGVKARHAAHLAEVGHFALRALAGPVRFDLAVVSVLPPTAISSSLDEASTVTSRHLATVAAAVVAEVPPALRARVVLMPFCRLGAAPGVPPCENSVWGGQYSALLVTYAMLAPHFKWAAALDLDEFLAPAPSQPDVWMGRAEKWFDVANSVRGYGGMTFGWLNFLASPGSARNLSADIAEGGTPRLKSLVRRGMSTPPSGSHCKLRPRHVGKPAVRCDVGIGFTIHSPQVRNVHADNRSNERDHGGSFLAVKGVQALSRHLFTWHPRMNATAGSCAYIHV